MQITEKQSAGQVQLTINGMPVSGIKGRTILETARNNEIAIHTLCYHSKLRPLGSCRLCVVEVEGVQSPVPACEMLISDEMVIQTHTPLLEDFRRETLKLLFLRHPMNCGACEISGECQLQTLAYEYDISHNDLHTYEIRQTEYPLASYATPLIKYHPRRCILCGRCIQACADITANRAIELKGVGATAYISPVKTDPALEQRCTSCGECMAICPVNALTEVMAPSKGMAWEIGKTETTCPYCGVGCQMELNAANNKVVGIKPSNGPVNKGDLCSKGRFGYNFINHKDRIRQPLIRKNGRWEEVGWDQAVDYISKRLIEIRSKYGPDTIGALSSARCTNEENYIVQKFIRGVIGTNNVDHCARL